MHREIFLSYIALIIINVLQIGRLRFIHRVVINFALSILKSCRWLLKLEIISYDISNIITALNVRFTNLIFARISFQCICKRCILIFSAFCVAGSRLWLDRTYWSSKLKNNWSLTFCSEELKEVHGPCTPSHAYNVATFYWIKLQGFKEGIHFHIRNLESLRPIGSCNTWGDHLLLSCKNSVPIQEFQIYD